MKTVFPSNEVPHIWAKQSQTEGRNSAKNIFFEGSEIYSYGSHFCMGRIVGNVAIITNRSYSNTTAKHLSWTRYAVNHMEQIFIAFPEKGLKENAKSIITAIKSNLDTLNNKRCKEHTRENASNSLASIVHDVEKFVEITGDSFKKSWYDKALQREFNTYFQFAKDYASPEQIAVALKKLATAEKKAETIKVKKAAKDLEENISRWLNGENVSLYDYPKVLLRVSLERPFINNVASIETSKGARVSLKAAKILFDRIQAGKNVVGFDIDGYTVISINGVLKVGCHVIERSEIERFAKTQNW